MLSKRKQPRNIQINIFHVIEKLSKYIKSNEHYVIWQKKNEESMMKEKYGKIGFQGAQLFYCGDQK